MAGVNAVVTEGWRTVLAELFARDVVTTQQQIEFFKVGEGGFIDVPPKEPDVPLPDRVDLVSEGVAIAGTTSFTPASAAVTGIGTSFTTDLTAGEYIKPQSDNTAGPAGGEDDWGQIQSITDDTNLVLTAPWAGIAGFAGTAVTAPEPFFTFRKSLTNGDVLFFSAVPAIVEIGAVVAAAESNANWSGGSPNFFELGLFDAAGVMLVYMTFPLEVKTGAVQLNHIIQLVF